MVQIVDYPIILAFNYFYISLENTMKYDDQKPNNTGTTRQ